MFSVEQIIIGSCKDSGHNNHTTNSSFYRATGSITLIRDDVNSQVILVDCGSPWDNSLLLQELQNRDVLPNKVTHVICTHGHIDHIGNLPIFTNAVFIMDSDYCTAPGLYSTINWEQELTLSQSVSVFSAPGHTAHDLSVIVRNVPALGTVVVAGDIFENADDEKEWKENSWNSEIQASSRVKIRNIADYIIPGHGPMFKVMKDV